MLTPRKRYRLNAVTIAVVSDDHGKKTAKTMPIGSIVEIVAVQFSQPYQLAVVDWEGGRAEVFVQDLEERGEEIPAAKERLPF
jgi:hypothetical protein